MPKRKVTLIELNQLLALSGELIARECKDFHPKRRVRCQLEAGHTGPHQWQRRRGVVNRWQ